MPTTTTRTDILLQEAYWHLLCAFFRLERLRMALAAPPQNDNGPPVGATEKRDKPPDSGPKEVNLELDTTLMIFLGRAPVANDVAPNGVGEPRDEDAVITKRSR